MRSINQQNLTEKNHQVRLMRIIYQNALQVVISLGKPTDDSALAMDFIETLRTAVRDLRQKKLLISEKAVLKRAGRPFRDPAWTALGKLFDRLWFTRIWVVQEV